MKITEKPNTYRTTNKKLLDGRHVDKCALSRSRDKAKIKTKTSVFEARRLS